MSSSLVARLVFTIVFAAVSRQAFAQFPAQQPNVSVGYIVRVGLSSTMSGIAVSGAIPIRPHLDAIAETTWATGYVIATAPFPPDTPDDAYGPYYRQGLRFTTVMGGVRASGTTRLYNGLRFFAQVVAGSVRDDARGPSALFSVHSFGIQPGVGVDFRLMHRVVLRGHADGIIGDLSILMPNGRSAGLSLVLGR